MVNYLGILENPQIKYEKVFEVMRDFRKGGINPDNFQQLLTMISQLPPINRRTHSHYESLTKLGLISVDENEFAAVQKEVVRRAIESSKRCWHPNASQTTCHINSTGQVIISAAHSIQNNGILNKIAENGHVMSYSYPSSDFEGESIGRNRASIFYGMCNYHDGIFRPIEVDSYQKTDEQNFLFAYRGLLHAYHKKYETSQWINYGNEWQNDFERNKEIFNKAITDQQYDILKTHIIELPSFYPIATSAGFYLDFDFEGAPIAHSDNRMELIFISLIPSINKTYFLLSYLNTDAPLYGKLGSQFEGRGNLKSDITMLIAAHVENVYFNPTYYKTFIEKHEASLRKILEQTQLDYGEIQDDNEIKVVASWTPSHYLNNNYDINFFGY